MTTNLLSVIEQQQKALEELLSAPNDDSPESVARCILSHTKARKAIAAGKQALEQTQVEAKQKSCYWCRHPAFIAGSSGKCPQCGKAHPQAAEPAPKRPPNCGTGHCSCIECIMEPAPSTAGEREALPMDTAPTDGTMIRLLVDFEGNSLEDTDQPVWTIGACYTSDSEGDVWQFAGWNWSHDRFTEGHGKPIGWLPMLDAALLSVPALPAAAMPVGELTPFPPNETGATHCVVRWMVETPKGWLGAYDKDAFSAYIAAASTQPTSKQSLTVDSSQPHQQESQASP